MPSSPLFSKHLGSLKILEICFDNDDSEMLAQMLINNAGGEIIYNDLYPNM